MLKDTDPISVFLFGDSAYPLLLFSRNESSGGSNDQAKSSSTINGLIDIITTKNSFNTLKAGIFRCLQRTKDININTLQ